MNRNDFLTIPLDRIAVPTRLREVDPDWAAVIAEGFVVGGQETPIWVRPTGDGRYSLIAGAHRLEAAHIAGWTVILARVFEVNQLQARLLEIDENLVRRELSELDRAAFLAERKQVWEALHPEAKHGGKRSSRQDGDLTRDRVVERFTLATAKLGLSERTIQRAIKRHQSLAPDVRRALATTPFAHSGIDLDALARLPVADQRRVVSELLRQVQPAGSVREAQLRLGLITPPQQEEAEKQFAALLGAWRKAGKPARDQFLRHLAAQGIIPAAPAMGEAA